MLRVSNKYQLITQFLEMLATENKEQAQEKMLEQFEQSLEHLDQARITSIEVLQSVIEEIQAIGDDSGSISPNEESLSERDLLWGGVSTLQISWYIYVSLKLTWVTQVLFGTNFYAVKLLRYSDLGAKYKFIRRIRFFRKL